MDDEADETMSSVRYEVLDAQRLAALTDESRRSGVHADTLNLMRRLAVRDVDLALLRGYRFRRVFLDFCRLESLSLGASATLGSIDDIVEELHMKLRRVSSDNKI